MPTSESVDFWLIQNVWDSKQIFRGSMRVVHVGTTSAEAKYSIGKSRAKQKTAQAWLLLASLLLPLAVLSRGAPLFAQTGGEAGIQGTVTDQTGAAIPHVLVTATNNATGVSTARETSSAGLYTISPIVPGTYTVTASATRLPGLQAGKFLDRRPQAHGPQHSPFRRLREPAGDRHGRSTRTGNHQCRPWRSDGKPDL